MIQNNLNATMSFWPKRVFTRIEASKQGKNENEKNIVKEAVCLQ